MSHLGISVSLFASFLEKCRKYLRLCGFFLRFFPKLPTHMSAIVLCWWWISDYIQTSAAPIKNKETIRNAPKIKSPPVRRQLESITRSSQEKIKKIFKVHIFLKYEKNFDSALSWSNMRNRDFFLAKKCEIYYLVLLMHKTFWQKIINMPRIWGRMVL